MISDSDDGRVKNILILSLDDPRKGGGVGGKHVHLTLLLKGLKEEGKKVDLVTVRRTWTFRFFHLYPGALYRRFLSDSDERFRHFTMQHVYQLKRNLKNCTANPDVLNPHDVLSANVVQDVCGMKIPIVLTLHGYFTMEALSNRELEEGSPAHTFFIDEERRAYEAASRIISVDNRIKDYLITRFKIPAGRISVIPNAIDTSKFVPPTEKMKLFSRLRLNIPQDRFMILCPRRLVPKNGVKFAVEALSSLKTKIPSALLVIAGDGPERDEIKRLIRARRLQDSVIMAGSVPHEDILTYYLASDVIVIPSIASEGVEEATSLSMLEGMSCGKPVIVTNVGGLRLIVRHKETGIIVNQADSDAIANELELLFRDRDLRNSIGISARKYVESNHSYRTHTKKMILEYTKAIEEDTR